MSDSSTVTPDSKTTLLHDPIIRAKAEKLKQLIQPLPETTQQGITDFFSDLTCEVNEVYSLTDTAQLALEAVGLLEGSGISSVLLLAVNRADDLQDAFKFLSANDEVDS